MLRAFLCLAAATPLFLLLSATSPAVAQVCCPAGCVQNNNGCVTTGPSPTFCAPVACQGSGGGNGSSGTPGRHSGRSPPVVPQSTCFALAPTQAQVDAATERCVSSLVATAQFLGCLFEDDAGRAEDRRTGLSCTERQAAMARQCRGRCERFAIYTTTRYCTYDTFLEQQWQAAFGDIGGERVGSARVSDCGPRLRSTPLSHVGDMPPLLQRK